jgi:hypothetical protein
MVTFGEKIIFGFLGAMAAVVIGLGVFHDFQTPSDRSPASQKEQVEYTPYPYFID